MTDAPTQPAGNGAPPAEQHPPALPPRAYSLIGLGCIALTLALLIALLVPVVSAWTAHPPPPVEPLKGSTIDTRKKEFASRLASAESKIKTRSPFSPPIVAAPPPPRQPARYGGPNVIGVAAGSVYFNDGKKIALGETHEDIKVIAINAPWSVKLGWMGGEYEVTLMERNPVQFGGTSSSTKDTLFKTVPLPPDSTASAPPPPSPRPQ